MADLHDVGIGILVKRSRLVIYSLIAGLAVTVAFFLFEAAEISGVWTFDENTAFDSSLGVIYGITGLGHSLIYLITVIIFGMWIYRAAANIVSAGTDGFSYSPGWAVGWYFIPFANFFKPFQAMRQIWNASHGATVHLDDNAPTLTIWWTAWLIATISGNISLRLTLKAVDADQMMLATQIGAISSIASFVLYPVAIRLVRDITRAQVEYLQIETLGERFS